jgi:hypothetical protein
VEAGRADRDRQLDAALLLLGLALAAPRPTLSSSALRVLLGRAVRRLAVPVLLGAGVVVFARVDTGWAGLWEHLAADCWWLSLAATAARPVARFWAWAAVCSSRHPLRACASACGVWPRVGC